MLFDQRSCLCVFRDVMSNYYLPCAIRRHANTLFVSGMGRPRRVAPGGSGLALGYRFWSVSVRCFWVSTAFLSALKTEFISNVTRDDGSEFREDWRNFVAYTAWANMDDSPSYAGLEDSFWSSSPTKPEPTGVTAKDEGVGWKEHGDGFE